MKIQTYLNCTQQKIEQKKFNIYIGISLGNKYFSKENIEKYILWALKNTKNDVAVLIADINHSINYEVLNGYNPDRALKTAIRKGLEKESIIKEIIANLPEKYQSLIKIAKWSDVRNSQNYKHSIPFIMDEFKNNTIFYDFIIRILKESLRKRVDNLKKEKLDKLASYILDELPILINGLEFDEKIYNLHPYPGLSSLDDLWTGLRNKKIFSELAEKIGIKNEIAEVEGYAD